MDFYPPSDALATWTPWRERIWTRVDKSGDCWLWTACVDRDGYGYMRINGRSYAAHRLTYVLEHGLIPDGLEIDHLCRNPPCVRPSHLEAVTHRTNMLRGDTPSGRHARQTHCIRGHEFAGDNLAITSDGRRRCRTCRRARSRT